MAVRHPKLNLTFWQIEFSRSWKGVFGFGVRRIQFFRRMFFSQRASCGWNWSIVHTANFQIAILVRNSIHAFFARADSLTMTTLFLDFSVESVAMPISTKYRRIRFPSVGSFAKDSKILLWCSCNFLWQWYSSRVPSALARTVELNTTISSVLLNTLNIQKPSFPSTVIKGVRLKKYSAQLRSYDGRIFDSVSLKKNWNGLLRNSMAIERSKQPIL